MNGCSDDAGAFGGAAAPSSAGFVDGDGSAVAKRPLRTPLLAVGEVQVLLVVRRTLLPMAEKGHLKHISAPNWQLSTSSPLDGPKPMYCGNWPVLPFGGLLPHCSFFIVCLLACLICLPALITIACDRTVDRPVPSFVLNHRGSGVAVVGTTRLPIGCPSIKDLSSSTRRR